MPGRAEADSLLGHRRIRLLGVVGGDELRDVDEIGGRGRRPGAAAGGRLGHESFTTRTACVCVTCATNRSSSSRISVRTTMVVRPTCSGDDVAVTWPARTAPMNTALDETVDVPAPLGRLRNAHTAPVLSARVISAPPCSTPAAVVRSSDHASRPTTSLFFAEASSTPVAAANGIIASSSAFFMTAAPSGTVGCRCRSWHGVLCPADPPDIPVALQIGLANADAVRSQVRSQADNGAALAEQVGTACAGRRLQFVDRGGQQVGRAGRYLAAVQPADRQPAALPFDPDL